MLKSIRESRLWVLPYFSGSALRVLFVLLRWLMKWEVSSRTAAVLWGPASRIYSERFCVVPHLAFFHAFCQSPGGAPYCSTDLVTAWKKSRFILSKRNSLSHTHTHTHTYIHTYTHIYIVSPISIQLKYFL